MSYIEQFCGVTYIVFSFEKRFCKAKKSPQLAP